MASPGPALRDFYQTESGNIRQRFEASHDGRAAVRARTDLVDSIAMGLWRRFISADPLPDFCLVALGGYGRQELFPHSDVDLLFLCSSSSIEGDKKEPIRQVCQEMWDLRLRVSPFTRTVAECGKLVPDNLEFNIALLDCRYLAGDANLFARLHDEVISQMVTRERRALVRNLADLTRARHAKHGHTIFHLEPNLKESPGGLRDYHVACWLALISRLDKEAHWPAPESLLPASLGAPSREALKFLSATRCFLHFNRERDDNALSYELQADAAEAGIGTSPETPVLPEGWMRTYFRHARTVDRLVTQLLDEVPPARSSLYDMFENWRSRLSNADFSVVQGRVFLRQPAAVHDAEVMLRLFEFLARHGLKLSGEAERHIEAAIPSFAKTVRRLGQFWPRLRQILTLPHAAHALRAMHRLGLLVLLFPELKAIESLVIRDYYHRYTVDEHSIMAIENLHQLRQPDSDLQRRYLEILSELEQPELLYLTLLFHDVGKGMPGDDHVAGSLQVAQVATSRLALPPADTDTVHFLIEKHLDMSEALFRRDIFDRETVAAFAEAVGTTERLKMLCLLTYADIKSVNPEALTPWKAEMLWQLYAFTANYLSRTLDQDRFCEDEQQQRLNRILPFVPGIAREDLNSFLKGLPRRYLLTRSPEQVAEDYMLAASLNGEPAAVRLVRHNHFYDLTVVTHDRPGLFATIAGTLSAWGMNIVKAEAFSNRRGAVLDTFHFTDVFRTLELNPSEARRLENSLIQVLAGKVNLSALMQGRVKPSAAPSTKVTVETKVHFDDHSSSHSTLLELVAQDRPGLLHQISSVIAELGCNIELALIDTEGQKAIDTFYLTQGGAKLVPEQQDALREWLVAEL